LEQPYILWGTPHSLYTGKARSYLIKKGLPFLERLPAHADFFQRVVPATKSTVVPVLETPDGAIIPDTTDIIDTLETRFPAPPMNPATPVLRAVALLLDAFGSEYMLPLAMHYRWSYRAEQEEFLRAEFGRAVSASPVKAERSAAADAFMGRFAGMIVGLGVAPAVIPAMEASYLELLDVLDAHCLQWPYMLGGRPSDADFGLIAPLFAHLGRDPVPASLMKARAPNLYRWTERMNRSGVRDGEFFECAEDYPADDAVPASLEPVLSVMFAHWAPGLLAEAQAFNAWCAEKSDAPAGTPVSADERARIHPTTGPIEYAWRGVTMKRASAPHVLWMVQRALDHVAAMDAGARQRLDALMARTGGAAITAVRLDRRLARTDNVLVLG
jgi:glutathione S-transferase